MKGLSTRLLIALVLGTGWPGALVSCVQIVYPTDPSPAFVEGEPQSQPYVVAFGPPGAPLLETRLLDELPRMTSSRPVRLCRPPLLQASSRPKRCRRLALSLCAVPTAARTAATFQSAAPA